MNPVTPTPLSLYVHLPWCVRKCPYCDFNSHAVQQAMPEAEYVRALLADLRTEQPRLGNRQFTSVFFGGGTPSLFGGASIERILAVVRELDLLADDAEVTLEANPGASDSARFHAYRAAGVNRLSIGVQSLDDDSLQRIGRIHDAAAAVAAVHAAHAAGFAEINLDLMHGLPGQDTTGALRDLEQAIVLEPTHLSWYELTLEPNTVFYARPPALPADDVLAGIQQSGQALLAARGYTRYEISAWRGRGRECRHNRNYWEFGDYLGIGAGAHSKLTDIRTGTIMRHARHRLPDRYLQLAGTPGAIVQTTTLGQDDLVLEFMLNACRLCAGFNLSLFEQRTGLPLASIEHHLHAAQARGLLDVNDSRARPTERGLRYLNDLLHLFMPEARRVRGAA